MTSETETALLRQLPGFESSDAEQLRRPLWEAFLARPMATWPSLVAVIEPDGVTVRSRYDVARELRRDDLGPLARRLERLQVGPGRIAVLIVSEFCELGTFEAPKLFTLVHETTPLACFAAVDNLDVGALLKTRVRGARGRQGC